MLDCVLGRVPQTLEKQGAEKSRHGKEYVEYRGEPSRKAREYHYNGAQQKAQYAVAGAGGMLIEHPAYKGDEQHGYCCGSPGGADKIAYLQPVKGGQQRLIPADVHKDKGSADTGNNYSNCYQRP